MKVHLPAGFWEMLFKDVEKHGFHPELVRRTLDISKSTFYQELSLHRADGVEGVLGETGQGNGSSVDYCLVFEFRTRENGINPFPA